jgi:type II secretory pathway component PulK
MKRIVSILMMVVMMTVTTSVLAQTPNKKQRISREQLAEKQAQHIAHDLAFDEKTTVRFIETYTECQKEIWALGPRPYHKKGEVKTDAQTEQEIKHRFEMSEKILDIRQKYYKKYSQFLTQQQIQRVYEIEKNMMKRFAQHAKGGKGQPGKRGPRSRR